MKPGELSRAAWLGVWQYWYTGGVVRGYPGTWGTGTVLYLVCPRGTGPGHHFLRHTRQIGPGQWYSGDSLQKWSRAVVQWGFTADLVPGSGTVGIHCRFGCQDPVTVGITADSAVRTRLQWESLQKRVRAVKPRGWCKKWSKVSKSAKIHCF